MSSSSESKRVSRLVADVKVGTSSKSGYHKHIVRRLVQDISMDKFFADGHMHAVEQVQTERHANTANSAATTPAAHPPRPSSPLRAPLVFAQVAARQPEPGSAGPRRRRRIASQCCRPACRPRDTETHRQHRPLAAPPCTSNACSLRARGFC